MSLRRHAASAASLLAILVAAPVLAQPRPGAATRTAGGRAEARHAVHPHSGPPEQRPTARRDGVGRDSLAIPGRALGPRALRHHENQHQQHARGVGLQARLGPQRRRPDGAGQTAPRRLRARGKGQQDRHRQRRASRDADPHAIGAADRHAAAPRDRRQGRRRRGKADRESGERSAQGRAGLQAVQKRLHGAEVRRGDQGRAGVARGVSELDARSHVPADDLQPAEARAGFGHRGLRGDSEVRPRRACSRSETPPTRTWRRATQ